MDVTVEFLFCCTFELISIKSSPLHFHFIYFVSDPHFSRVPLGLWFDLEISYSGSFLMTLETKMNLIRLGKEGESVRFGETGKDG